MSTIILSETSPEYKAFRECYDVLVNTSEQQVGKICDSLFADGYISETVRDYTRTIGMPDLIKAQKLVDSVSNKIKTNFKMFHGFIAILEGPFNTDTVQILQERYRKACEHKSFHTNQSERVTYTMLTMVVVSSGDESFHSAIDA